MTTFPSEVSEIEKIRDDALADMAKGCTLDLIERYETARDVAWGIRLDAVRRKYTNEALRKLIIAEFDSQLEYCRLQTEKQYAMNDELRAKGVPFVERMKLLDKKRLDMLERQAARLVRERASFHVVPVDQWFTQDDWDLAKKKGIGFVIRLNFSRTYTVANQPNHGYEEGIN